MHLGKIDNKFGSGETPTSIYVEPPKSVAAREKIIRNHGFLNEKGGIGFSVLFGVGVTRPESGKVDTKECMREEEIVETINLLRLGNKVLWEGGEGFGKTTFTGELTSILLKEQANLKIITLTHNDFLTNASMQRQIESLNLESENKSAEKVLYLLDSIDYLWEKIPSNLDAVGLAQKRIEFIQTLLESDHKVVMTAHDTEPRNKDIDVILKIRLNSLFNVFTVRKKLSPVYPPSKVAQVLERVGFPHDLAIQLVTKNLSDICRHSVLVNYFFKQPNLQSETDKQQFSLTRSLQFVESSMKTQKDPIRHLISVFQSVFAARNKIRFQDG